MKKNAKSVLRFENYIVKNVVYEYNVDCEEDDDGVQIDFDIDTHFEISPEGKEMLVFLKLIVFDNPVENNYPFKLELEIVGQFSIGLGEENDIRVFKTNALAILFPYARALVSSYTANSNVTPLILPTININKFLAEKNS